MQDHILLRPQLREIGLQQLVRSSKKWKTSNARRIQTNSTIDSRFGEPPPTSRPHLRLKGERPVRSGTPRRRPLPVSTQKCADAKRRRTAPSYPDRSCLRRRSTKCINHDSIGGPVCPLGAAEHDAKTPLVQKPVKIKPIDQSTSASGSILLDPVRIHNSKESARFGLERPVDAHFRFSLKSAPPPNDYEPRRQTSVVAS